MGQVACPFAPKKQETLKNPNCFLVYSPDAAQCRAELEATWAVNLPLHVFQFHLGADQLLHSTVDRVGHASHLRYKKEEYVRHFVA